MYPIIISRKRFNEKNEIFNEEEIFGIDIIKKFKGSIISLVTFENVKVKCFN